MIAPVANSLLRIASNTREYRSAQLYSGLPTGQEGRAQSNEIDHNKTIGKC